MTRFERGTRTGHRTHRAANDRKNPINWISPGSAWRARHEHGIDTGYSGLVCFGLAERSHMKGVIRRDGRDLAVV